MDKFGFVYLWRDRKHNRYYVGRHWGTEDDGYICSSRLMREAYNRRKDDFKRRILVRVDNKVELIAEEQRFLDMIKKEERGIRYYNRSLQADVPTMFGRKHSEETKERIGASNRGKIISEETKERNRQANFLQFQNKEQRESRRQKALEQWSDPEYRRIQTERKLGKPTNRQWSEESRRKISEKKKGKYFNPPLSDETRERLSKSVSDLIWINDGTMNTRINKDMEIPGGFARGRCKK